MAIVAWHGPRIAAEVLAASLEAVNETTEAAANAAEQNHWWRRQSGNLDTQIIHEDAKIEGRMVVGKFGTTARKGFYGLFLERQQQFLRPPADSTFPTLQARIRAKLIR